MKNLLQLLNSPTPGALLREWHANGLLAERFPEIHVLFGVPQNPEHHPEIDTGEHIALCLDAAHRMDATVAARFAVLVHDLGKGLTPQEDWPKHVDHENRGLVPVQTLCTRVGVPDYWRKLALLVCEYHLHAHRVLEMRSHTIIKLLRDNGMLSDRTLLIDYTTACECDKRGRLGAENASYVQGQVLRKAAYELEQLPTIPSTDTSDATLQHRIRIEHSIIRTAKELATPPVVEV